MSAELCYWCHSDEPVTIDPDGDGCCSVCMPLLDPDGSCGYCGEGTPIKMVGDWPACMRCLNAFHEAGCLNRVRRAPYRLVTSTRALTVRQRLEEIAREAGLVSEDMWQLSVADFVARVLDARMLKLGLVKARDPEGIARLDVANEGGRR